MRFVAMNEAPITYSDEQKRAAGDKYAGTAAGLGQKAAPKAKTNKRSSIVDDLRL
jgi:hypothetical protein